MKRQIRKYPFNMVEIALAMAIIAIGLSGILVLFPVGINASKSAIADNNLADIAEYIGKAPLGPVGVLLSGDTGFYSGAEAAGRAFAREGWDVEYIPGISSLSYFCARLGKSWQNVHALSLHGRDADLTAHVRMHKSCFVILGEPGEAAKVCRE